LTRITPAWAHLGWTKQLLIFGNHDPDLGREDLPQATADIEHAIAWTDARQLMASTVRRNRFEQEP